MNSWELRFQQHRMQNELTELNKLIDAYRLNSSQTQIVADYERLVSVVKQFTAFVRSLDPNLTSDGYLNELTGILQQLRGYCSAFMQSGHPAHLQNANNLADQLGTRIVGIVKPEMAGGLIQAATDYSKQIGGLLTTLQDQVKASSAQVQEVIAKAKAEDLKISQHDKTLQQQQSRFDKAYEGFQARFSDEEAKRQGTAAEGERQRNEQFNVVKEEILKQNNVLIDKNAKDIHGIIAQFKGESRKLIDDLEEKRAKAAELLQITANITVTGNFVNLAADEKSYADWWRYVAMGFMSALVVMAGIIAFFTFKEGTFNWGMILFRYATAFILALPALYAMSESSHHRKMQRKYRQMHLELASIDPFIVSLQEDKRDELKKTLADRIFAQPEPIEKEPTISVRKVFHLAEKAVEGMAKKSCND